MRNKRKEYEVGGKKKLNFFLYIIYIYIYIFGGHAIKVFLGITIHSYICSESDTNIEYCFWPHLFYSTSEIRVDFIIFKLICCTSFHT
jgi:hypothetical protein